MEFKSPCIFLVTSAFFFHFYFIHIIEDYIFLLIISFTLFGCNSGAINDSVVLPPTQTLPLPDLDDDDLNDDKKKVYAFSNVNGLRVRNKPSDNSTTIGTLDKNDAIILHGKENGYYITTFKEKTAYVFASYCSTFEIERADDKVENAIDFGSTLLGYPYVWGSERYHWGNGKLNSNFVNGKFDCSALVQYVYYKSNRVLLDLTSRTQSLNGVEVKRSNLQRGDLMFFTNASRKNKTGIERIGHVGIYFGNNYILHTASDHAVIEPISNARWNYYVTARRVI